jgi:hypothetical protein
MVGPRGDSHSVPLEVHNGRSSIPMEGNTMIDPLNDELLTATQAAKLCPRVAGKKPHVTIIWRWAKEGVGGIRLEHVVISRTLYTTREALHRFFRDLAAAPLQERVYDPTRPGAPTPAQRRRAFNAARKRLEAALMGKVEPRK